ncbi:hypothetical protein FAGKG844_640021 [Frankia sp. AgKG'84/4]
MRDDDLRWSGGPDDWAVIGSIPVNPRVVAWFGDMHCALVSVSAWLRIGSLPHPRRGRQAFCGTNRGLAREEGPS